MNQCIVHQCGCVEDVVTGLTRPCLDHNPNIIQMQKWKDGTYRRDREPTHQIVEGMSTTRTEADVTPPPSKPEVNWLHRFDDDGGHEGGDDGEAQ